jgi:CHRD domain
MVRRLRLWVVAAVVLGGLAAGSYAVAGTLDKGPKPPKVPDSKQFRAHLTGYQETPSISSTGFGEFQATLVEDQKLHYVFQYENLEGGASLFAHVHFGQRGVAGGVSFFLCGGSTKPTPCPNVSGTVEGDVTPADVVGPNAQGIEPGSFAEILQAMRTGHAYANIHTTRWPGGEIRGQINANQDKVK